MTPTPIAQLADVSHRYGTTVALDDDFSDAFKEARGKVDPKLKLGF